VTTDRARAFAISALAEIERIPLTGSPALWTPVRAHFGIEAFGITRGAQTRVKR
jgi:hypothetical protein